MQLAKRKAALLALALASLASTASASRTDVDGAPLRVARAERASDEAPRFALALERSVVLELPELVPASLEPHPGLAYRESKPHVRAFDFELEEQPQAPQRFELEIASGTWETGLLYVRNRYYDPELGRFISADPLGYVDGPSFYSFADNDPANYRDPLGLSSQLDPDTYRLVNRVQTASEEAARRHGLFSQGDVLSSGHLGMEFHETARKLLSSGGEFSDPRLLTEVAVDAQGRILSFGSKITHDDSLIKDVVILKPGVSRSSIRLGKTLARDVTAVVVDFKLGEKGADLLDAKTLLRFGTTNLRLKPYFDLLETQPKFRLSVAKKLSKFPALAAVALGFNLADATQALAQGDVDRAADLVTGLELYKQGVQSVGNAAEETVRDWAEGLGISARQREELSRDDPENWD